MPDAALHLRVKLSPDQDREIRLILAQEPVSYATLAVWYGVSEPTISHIANTQEWRHLVAPAPPDRALITREAAAS